MSRGVASAEEFMRERRTGHV